MNFVGRSVTRLEDRPLVTGRGRFAADVAFPRMLHMRVVRSAHAHGRILSIDTSAALALPGVVAVWTLADVADIPPIDFRLTRIEGLAPYRQPILARKRVRYVGEPVAAVFATDPYLAEDAADLVAVEVEELPVVLDAERAPGEFEDGRSTEPAIVEKSYGDVAAAFRQAHAVVELDLAIGRHSGVPLETRGAIARYDAARDVLELHGAAKVPHWNRDSIARMLGRDPSTVHLFEGHVGGGFGIRGELYPEDVLVCLAALRLGRPVKWIEDRREHLIAANHSRQQRHEVRAAVDAARPHPRHRRRILPRPGRLRAHPRGHGARSRGGHAAGPYRVPAYRALGHVRLTNKTPGGTYRAPGRFESTFVRERLMDAIAARLGIDRIEVRRRNLIAEEEMPYRAAARDARHRDRARFRRLCRPARQGAGCGQVGRAAGRSRGAGVPAANASGRVLPSSSRRAGSDRSTACGCPSIASGLVEVVTGAASLGQGVETVVAQICADALGVDYRRVRVVHGRTDRIAFGMGAFASRVTVMTGEATRLAAVEVRAKAIDVAAELLQQPADALDIVDGKVVRKASRRRTVDDARRDRQGAGAGLEAARRAHARASRPTAGSTPIT